MSTALYDEVAVDSGDLAEWTRRVKELYEALIAEGIPPASAPHEEAEVMTGGGLLLFVRNPDGGEHLIQQYIRAGRWRMLEDLPDAEKLPRMGPEGSGTLN